jgi:asparagine synthase (glutamine-hydrolysing)
MCGISGLIAPSESVARDALARMDCAQKHRGPDDKGQSLLPFGDRFLGLGHRRLSIIDLSPLGHQPMIHPITGDQITFNGEIYNFQDLRRELESAGERFRGHSDTEVMLHALALWGPDAVRRFHGMFAFAYYNARQPSLMLARDSVGIKPLYVAIIDGGLVFASEVRAILATKLVAPKLSRAGLATLMAYGSVQQPLTIVEGIGSFPPGHYEIFSAAANGGRKRPVTFWSFPSPRAGRTEQELVPEIRATLDVAVRDHLIADVPVGVFLSSGLDSTVVASLAARHSSGMRSFTVGFADQPDLSEQVLATQTAQRLGLVHTDIQVTARDCEEAAVEWLGRLDQPSQDGLNVYVISKVVRAQGITVALSGQGGDELFGGYASFRDVPRLKTLVKRLRLLPWPLRRTLINTLSVGKSEAYREKLLDLARCDGSVASIYLHRRRAMSDSQLAALGLHAAELGLTPLFEPPAAMNDLGSTDDVVASVSRLESIFYQGNTLLRDSDANGMAHSLEIRVPLLDQRMLDLVMPIPGSLRLPKGTADKHLMRAAFHPELPPALLGQKKRGFSMPIRRWMIGPLRELCERSLAHLKRSEVLRPEGVDAIWKSFLAAPESPIWSRAFTLCVAGRYLETTGLG